MNDREEEIDRTENIIYTNIVLWLSTNRRGCLTVTAITITFNLYRYIIQFLHAGRISLTPPQARHWTLRKLLWRKLVTLMSACSGGNYNFRCINVVFGVFLRESARTAAKSRTNLSTNSGKATKRLGRLAPNLAHVWKFIWERIYAIQIAPQDTREALGVFRG